MWAKHSGLSKCIIVELQIQIEGPDTGKGCVHFRLILNQMRGINVVHYTVWYAEKGNPLSDVNESVMRIKRAAT